MTDVNVAEKTRNRAAAAFLLLLGAVGAGYAALHVNIDRTYVEGTWVAPNPTGREPNSKWCGVVRGPSSTWTALGLTLSDGGSGLALACVAFYEPPECAEGADAGWIETDAGQLVDPCVDEAQVLPALVEWSPAEEYVVPYSLDGGPTFQVWVAEHPSAPWKCACGVTMKPQDGQCQKWNAEKSKWENASEDDMALQPGQWRGSCRRHPCSSWGESTTPVECCTTKCKTGWECGTDKCGGTCGTCAPIIVDGGVEPEPAPACWTNDAGGTDCADAARAWTVYVETECRGHKCHAVPSAGPDAGADAD